MDSLDEKLVKLLGTNARQTSKTLAKKLNVNPSTIRRRVQKLISDETIHIVAIPDIDKVGLKFGALIALDVEADKLEEVAEKLAAKEEVTWLSITTGRYDVIAITRFHSAEEFFNFMQGEVGEMDGIRDTETFVCLKRTKSR